MKFLLIFCALIPHVYVIIFIRPFTAHKSIFHISSHGRGDVIFVNCVLTLAIPFLFSCNCARPVNLGCWEQRHEGGGERRAGEFVVCGVGPAGRRRDLLQKCTAALMRKYHFLQLTSFQSDDQAFMMKTNWQIQGEDIEIFLLISFYSNILKVPLD